MDFKIVIQLMGKLTFQWPIACKYLWIKFSNSQEAEVYIMYRQYELKATNWGAQEICQLYHYVAQLSLYSE